MRTVKLITYNPETESYETSFGTLTTTHFTSYDITCTDELHVGRNLWVGDQFLSAEAIRNLKTTPETLALKSLRANDITVLDKSVDELGMLSVSNIYTNNVYGAQIMSNKADIGVVTCSQVKFGDLTLDETLLSQLIDGSGSSSGGGSSSQEIYSDYAYITNFVSARDFRLSGGKSNSGSLQLGTRDFMYVQYDSEAQVVNTFARGVFHADDAEIENLSVSYMKVGGHITTPSLHLGNDSDYFTLDTEYLEDLSSSVEKNSTSISEISSRLDWAWDRVIALEDNCLTAENFTSALLGDKLSNLMTPVFTKGALEYPIGYIGLFVSYNPNDVGRAPGLTNEGHSSDSPINLYEFQMELSGESYNKSLNVSVFQDDPPVMGRWKFLTFCALEWGLVLAIRVS